MSALPGTNRTTFNYDLIATSPTEQRKRLRRGGLCCDGTCVLGEHVARVASAKWNVDGRGGAAVTAPGLPPGGELWSSGPARGFAAS